MPALVESMMYVREKPWHGLGTRVEEAPTSTDALRMAGLDWSVVQRNIQVCGGAKIKNYKANVRDSDGTVLGVVSDRYKILESIGAIENTIKADMGEAERGDCGIYSVSWKSQTRQIFQPQEFARAHPEIDLAPFYKQITARPFKVKVSEVEKNLKNVG